MGGREEKRERGREGWVGGSEGGRGRQAGERRKGFHLLEESECGVDLLRPPDLGGGDSELRA